MLTSEKEMEEREARVMVSELVNNHTTILERQGYEKIIVYTRLFNILDKRYLHTYVLCILLNK